MITVILAPFTRSWLPKAKGAFVLRLHRTPPLSNKKRLIDIQNRLTLLSILAGSEGRLVGSGYQ